jgi:hypothetical protein
MISFADFAKHLQTSIKECHPRLEVGLAKVGELTQTMAVEYIGHEMPQWPALADRTIAEKTRLGYVGHLSPTDPLLRTGEMRDSIHVVVERLTQTVGSDSAVARAQELGTATIPPRPFIAPAALASLPYAHDVFGKIAVSLLVPGKRP